MYICILYTIKTIDINILVVYLYVNRYCMETKRRAMLPWHGGSFSAMTHKHKAWREPPLIPQRSSQNPSLLGQSCLEAGGGGTWRVGGGRWGTLHPPGPAGGGQALGGNCSQCWWPHWKWSNSQPSRHCQKSKEKLWSVLWIYHNNSDKHCL